MTPKRYAYIDAMRGYAILLVIAVHSSHHFNDLLGSATENSFSRCLVLKSTPVERGREKRWCTGWQAER
jgi:peptidoglycan/LPS O-acetylase OafA/YrhL